MSQHVVKRNIFPWVCLLSNKLNMSSSGQKDLARCLWNIVVQSSASMGSLNHAAG